MANRDQVSSGIPLHQEYFEFAFAAADLAALWWQPLLKGFGRTHLEVATMQSRNAKAWLQWGRAVSISRSPAELVAANVGLCENVFGHIGEAIPKVSGALSQAAQTPAALKHMQPRVERLRDSLEIAGCDQAPERDERTRLVA